MIEVQSLTKRFGGNMFGIRSGSGKLGSSKSDGSKSGNDKSVGSKPTSSKATGSKPTSSKSADDSLLNKSQQQRLRIGGKGGFLALQDVSLTVESGEVYGLVGYNGAGKTTLLKCIATIYRPDSGRVLIDGILSERTSPGTLFIVADEPYFMSQATPAQMQKYYRGYYPAWDSELFSTLLEIFGLSASARIEGFSKGMQRQCGIALGLASGASALLLDESFDGLDLSKRNLIKRLLAAYASERHASVVITSHNLTEIEDVATSLGMIDGHKLVFTGSVAQVHQLYPDKSLEEIFLDTGCHGEVDVAALFAR
ncbi:MAG: ABC transporter ATP-binding protein [Coriobacteriales bacterium]|jgi:ABC-2 type transport system ATP-binding protein|nr:ABC transporter ATP-binding protein [Coriobacteriales bacterium]